MQDSSHVFSIHQVLHVLTCLVLQRINSGVFYIALMNSAMWTGY